MVTEQPDTDRAARRPSDKKRVVEWVLNSPDLQETDWLEWKIGYDLSRNPGRASVAKHLIGFANRHPDTAERTAEGHAYLLLGVEPGSCQGMPIHDSADIETWLRPFVGDNLIYDIEYVRVDGTPVLFITVDPPRWGDDIHRLMKASEDVDSGKTLAAGRIFVRKAGKTEEANADDVGMLTARARRQGAALRLRVEAKEAVLTLDPRLFTNEERDTYLAERSKTLLVPLPKSEPLLSALGGAVLRPAGEHRSPEAFRHDVDRFLSAASKAWPRLAAVLHVERDRKPLRLAIVNETDDNYENVVVELTLPLNRSQVHFSAYDARNFLQPPREPAKWGSSMTGLLADIGTSSGRVRERAIEPDGDETLVRFAPVHVRPRTTHPLGSVHLIVLPQNAGQPLQARWRATSSSTRGEVAGTLMIATAHATEQ